jgi:hypothetical protein
MWVRDGLMYNAACKNIREKYHPLTDFVLNITLKKLHTKAEYDVLEKINFIYYAWETFVKFLCIYLLKKNILEYNLLLYL